MDRASCHYIEELLEQVSLLREADRICAIAEALHLQRRDLLSRIERRVRDKHNPQARDVLRARRERKARNREHSMKRVKAPPRRILSTKFRLR